MNQLCPPGITTPPMQSTTEHTQHGLRAVAQVAFTSSSQCSGAASCQNVSKLISAFFQLILPGLVSYHWINNTQLNDNVWNVTSLAN